MKDKNPLDDDYDGKPGGRGFSAEFSRRYDPQGEQEYTNLPLNDEQLNEEFADQEAEQRESEFRKMRESAGSRTHYWPNVGRFVIPRENTFSAHLQLVQSDAELQFDPLTYKLFDRVIVESANRPDIFDPNHRDYPKYATLRENLAVLRNDVMGIYMDDGSFDPGDEKFIPQLTSIAAELGQAIGNEKRMLPKLFAPSLDTRLLNMEADGAAYAYRYLEKRNKDAVGLNAVINTIRAWMGIPVREWDLPPVEYTAFSEDGLNALPPVDALCLSDAQLRSYIRSLQKPIEMDVAREEQTRQDIAVEDKLDNAQKRVATEEGITILRWFKNIKFSDKSVMELMDTGTPEEKAEMVGVVAKFVQYYQQVQTRALKRDPNLANNEKIQAANDAAKVLSHSIELLAKLEKPISISQTQQISTDVTQQPEKWGELAGKTVDRLMQTLKGGLETAVSAFEQQQQDQEQGQEEAIEQAVQAAIQGSDASRRKRRRRAQVSGKGAKTAAKVDQALRADDRAAGQGIYANSGSLRVQREQAQDAFRQSMQVQELNLKDMELVRSLGKALAGRSAAANVTGNDTALSGRDAAQAAAREEGRPNMFGVADVSPNDKLKPDDQDIAKTIIDQRRREQNNPKPKGMK